MVRISLLISFMVVSLSARSQRLERFGRTDEAGVKLGYSHIKNYYGFIENGSKPDTIIDDKQVYYLYFHLDDTLPDLGLRLINPVPKLSMPDKGDFVSDGYYENEKDKSGTFNTWMALEKEDDALWVQLAFNDDGNETPEATNSVIRIKDKKNNRLVPGNYRIVISSSKKEKIAGGFLVQLGSFGNMKPVKLSPHN